MPRIVKPLLIAASAMPAAANGASPSARNAVSSPILTVPNENVSTYWARLCVIYRVFLS